MKYLLTLLVGVFVLAGNAMAAAVLERTTTGWDWIINGQHIPFMAALTKVDDADLAAAGTKSQVLAKYGTWLNWANAQQTRFKSIGLNAAGMYSYRYSQQLGTDFTALPFAPTVGTSLYAMLGKQGTTTLKAPVHDAFWFDTNGSMKCARQTYRGKEADAFDPNWSADVNAILGTFWNGTANGPALSTQNVAWVVPEEADWLFGVNQMYTHAELGYVVAANNPSIKTITDSYGTVTYADATNTAKVGLSNYLAQKYVTVAALNAAWGTNYTTFQTSDPLGMTGIRQGTYASYGTGTGFLDENGVNLVAATFNCAGAYGTGPGVNDAWAKVPQIKTDVETWTYTRFAVTYAGSMRTAWKAACGSNCPPEVMPIYDGPSGVYQNMAGYVDAFEFNFVASNSPAFPADAERIIAAVGVTVPLLALDYSTANPDSPFAAYPCPYGDGQACYLSQPGRGNGLVSKWQTLLGLKNSSGKYPIVGLEHWSLYDDPHAKENYGFATDTDNLYNGVEATPYGDLITPIQTFLKSGSR